MDLPVWSLSRQLVRSKPFIKMTGKHWWAPVIPWCILAVTSCRPWKTFQRSWVVKPFVSEIVLTPEAVRADLTPGHLSGRSVNFWRLTKSDVWKRATVLLSSRVNSRFMMRNTSLQSIRMPNSWVTSVKASDFMSLITATQSQRICKNWKRKEECSRTMQLNVERLPCVRRQSHM